jgi:hypothetical protein
MIALAGCSTQHRILVIGLKSVELVLDLHRRGYLRSASSGNCGRAAKQYDVALVDWRWRTLNALEATLDWLVNFLNPKGLLVVWANPQKPTVNQSPRDTLKRRGFIIEQGIVHDWGCAISARRNQTSPVRKVA